MEEITNKEDACLFINNKVKALREKEQNKYDSEEIGRVKVPIYNSKWKITMLRVLQFFLKKRAYGYFEENPKISSIDFSKFIPSDSWKEYSIKRETKSAKPKYMKEHEYCWEVNSTHEFFQEDLQYGVRPISIYERITEIGGGPILLDKENGEIYFVGSGVWANCDHINDFSTHKKGKESQFDWSKPPNVYFKKNKTV